MKIQLLGIFTFLVITGCVSKSHRARHELPKGLLDRDIFASTILEPRSGSEAQGKAWFKKDKSGLHVIVTVTNASPGLHGIHIHENGDCSAHDAASAGAHYNPTKLVHGSPDPLKYHAGDLGNIQIGKDGSGTLDIVISTSDFHPKFKDWKKIVGKSLVLHKRADDLVSQPAGDSGDRIACGVIAKE